ncbi:MAG: hypothetical protein ACOVOD_07615, partial [Rhodoferax sp.]
DCIAVLGGVQVLIVDEWHELLGNKRGTQLLLALARMRRFNPGLRVWGLSATLGNLTEACEALTGPGGVTVRGATPKTGPLRAMGEVLHCGRQLATAEARIVGPDGKLYAHASTTCLVFELPSA